MKKEEAYRDKNANYVAFVYDGHVFVLKTIKGTANGKTWTNPRYAFCPISSDTEFAVRFTTVEEAIVAVEKIWLKPIYTRHWEELEESFPGVDKLKWKEWHEYQEVLRHKAPFAAIAVGNRVYKDTYSTALSDGNAWVFAAGEERLVGFSSRLTHKIDQLLFAVRQYPDIKLFDTAEERTEWSLKYLEEYAAKPEPTPVVLTTDGTDESWAIATPTAFPVTDINGKPLLSDTYRIKASSDASVIAAMDGIKTMEPGVIPQPSRSRIGKIAARPYEYVYDGPQQMGTTFVSRYRIDDEVWVRVGHELVKMRVTGIYVEHEQGSTAYSYFLKHPIHTIGGTAESQLYDTLFDLISAMTSISVEELIAAAKEVA
jgi:hypothetical protein